MVHIAISTLSTQSFVTLYLKGNPLGSKNLTSCGWYLIFHALCSSSLMYSKLNLKNKWMSTLSLISIFMFAFMDGPLVPWMIAWMIEWWKSLHMYVKWFIYAWLSFCINIAFPCACSPPSQVACCSGQDLELSGALIAHLLTHKCD